MNTKMSEFGCMVRRRRMELDLTQKELAERSGITQAHISHLENGEYNISSVTICKLAKALNIPVAKLLEAAVKKAV